MSEDQQSYSTGTCHICQAVEDYKAKLTSRWALYLLASVLSLADLNHTGSNSGAAKDTLLYCSACDHWFCRDCRTRYFARGLEYVKQLVGGRREGCCGPVAP